MFDLNISINNLIKNCFPFKNKNQIKIKDFINSIKNHNSEIRINMILERIVNGTWDLAIIYKNDIQNNSLKLISYYGDYELSRINYLNIVSIPIYQNSVILYFLIIATNKKKKIKI